MGKVANPDLEEEIEDHQQEENEHNEPTHEALEELATDISRRWLGAMQAWRLCQGSSVPLC